MKNRPCITFNKFSGLVAEAGLTVTKCSEVHWQVHGKCVNVNYYPTTRKAFVNGTTIGYPCCTPKGAISLALGNLPSVTLSKRPKNTKGLRQRLYSRSNICFLCKKFMSFEESSLEHIIPLSKGGSNYTDNLTLSHKECNLNKADSLVERPVRVEQE